MPKLAGNDRTRLLWPAVIIVVVTVIDQITKLWAVSNLTNGESVQVLGNFFRLTLVFNRGGAMGTQLGSPLYYLIAAVIILPFIAYYIFHHQENKSISFSLAFIAGGAIGNIIDRIRLGEVIDFIDVDFFDIDMLGFQLDRWWTFNVADAAIFCAIIFLLIYLSAFHRTTRPVGSPRRVNRPTDQPFG